ncbi:MULTISPECIES: hypothetical protein [Streptomyces]|uniref:Uncharacterized protein n=1 Tax=Streptomyces lonegramiae TaxID=3075524 RepID=A0ABU2XNL7_9ACTN|nr:hypothetical protein [Streptomyces sp. DSM 41529]MDT0547519.1 hypothetical protein [Streptomyces sp. DSM 41529]
MRVTWGATLVALGDEDPRTVVLDGDLATSTKADAFAQAHPERFLQMGIAFDHQPHIGVGLRDEHPDRVDARGGRRTPRRRTATAPVRWSPAPRRRRPGSARRRIITARLSGRGRWRCWL